jgi:hypothetical protein
MSAPILDPQGRGDQGATNLATQFLDRITRNRYARRATTSSHR